MKTTIKINLIRTILHFVWFIVLTWFTVILSKGVIQKGDSGIVLIAPFILLLVSIMVVYPALTYLKVDLLKKTSASEYYVEVNQLGKQLKFNPQFDIKDIVLVKATPSGRNLLLGFSFLQITLKSGEKFYLTSMSNSIKKFLKSTKLEPRHIELGFPRIGVNTAGKDEELIETLTKDLIDLDTPPLNSVKFFQEKYSNKSKLELQTIINNSEMFQEEAVKAAENLLKNSN